MHRKLKIFVFFLIILAFIYPSQLYAKERIGVIYPSLFITEELASFTQAIMYLNTTEKVDLMVVNGKPDTESLTQLYYLLKKNKVKEIIIRDDIYDISNFYTSTSLTGRIFSFSPSLSLPNKKNIYRVVPTIIEMAKAFKDYVEKRGSPNIYLIMEGLTKKDTENIAKLFKSYKGKWALLNPKDILNSFGLNEEFSFKERYIFLYMHSYKKAGILIQLMSKKTKKFHVVIFENLLSPSFFHLLPNPRPEILVEEDMNLKPYQKDYNKFKASIEPREFLSSLYDFAKLQYVYKFISLGKKPKKENFKISIQELKVYE